jgi:hypothetical protein
MSAADKTSPAALCRLLVRLLDDHQRAQPHHAHLCPLCQDTTLALDLLAEELPDDGGECPCCGAAAGDIHLTHCPADGNAAAQDRAAIPLGISHYQLPNGTTGGSYPSSNHQPR